MCQLTGGSTSLTSAPLGGRRRSGMFARTRLGAAGARAPVWLSWDRRLAAWHDAVHESTRRHAASAERASTDALEPARWCAHALGFDLQGMLHCGQPLAATASCMVYRFTITVYRHVGDVMARRLAQA